jgi:fructokinase
MRSYAEIRPPREILVAGESLIDVVIDESGNETRVPGGSPCSVALGLSRLGERVGLLTYLANDSDGLRIVRHLTADGVRILPESLGARRTPAAMATVNRGGHVHYDFYVEWSLPPVTEHTVPALLHIGSYSAFLEPGCLRIDELIERARNQGSLISFDPNIRPQLLPSAQLARSRFRQLVEQADVVKLSDEDARWIYPDAHPDQVLRDLANAGPRLVALTCGARGSLLATPDLTIDLAAMPAKVIDTVGAGDSYMAALIQSALHCDLGNLSPQTLHWIGARSAASAAVTVSRRGADLPWSADLEAPSSAAAIAGQANR